MSTETQRNYLQNVVRVMQLIEKIKIEHVVKTGNSASEIYAVF